MNDLDHREQAQLGLKYIEDAVVNLLTRHPKGLSSAAIADMLGLRTDLSPPHGQRIVVGILEMLVHSGRILEDKVNGTYLDNPSRS